MSSTDSDEQKAPVRLVSNEKGKLRLNPEGLEVLRAETRPVVVVAITGPIRMGKSYLLNRIAGRVPGFSVESTVQSHTKGIWVWNMPHPERPDQRILLLDAEGLGDAEKGDEENDNYIFALSILLSSMFVYNRKEQIDHASLSNLLIVSKLVNLIQVDSGKDNESQGFVSFFPDFVWVLRDLTLDLEIDGKAVNADQYLENALKLRKGDSERDNDFNNLRRSLREFFPTRRCFAMVMPAHRTHLKRLQEVTDKELDPDFVQEFTRFSNFIHQKGRVKTTSGGLQVTGERLATLLETYMEAIDNGTLPCIETAVQRMIEIENDKAMKKALELYDGKVAGIEDISHQLVSVQLTRYHSEAIEEFCKHSPRDKNGYCAQLELQKTLETRAKDLWEKLESESTQRCQDTLANLKRNLQDKLNSSYYTKSGGFAELQTDVEEIVKMFRSESEKEPMFGNVLESFRNEMATKYDEVKQIENDIRAKKAMEELNEKLKHMEENSKRVEEERKHAEEERKYAEEERKRKEEEWKFMEEERKCAKKERKRVEEERKHESEQLMKEMMINLQKEAEKNKAQHIKELELIMANRELEAQKYAAEGYKRDAERMKAEVRQYEQKGREAQSDSSCMVM